MKAAKHKYFNKKIASIVDHNKRPWDLRFWTHTQKPDSLEAIIVKANPVSLSKVTGILSRRPLTLHTSRIHTPPNASHTPQAQMGIVIHMGNLWVS